LVVFAIPPEGVGGGPGALEDLDVFFQTGVAFVLVEEVAFFGLLGVAAAGDLEELC
jgi:hypothetical protein